MKRIPGTFSKSIKEKTFNRRYLKHIEKPGDKDWLKSQFELRDEKYYLRDGFDKKDTKHLKGLFVIARKNRKGPIKIFPIALTGIVVGGIVIFFTVFANPLLEAAMEAGLEAAFEAKSDVNRLRLSLFKFSIAIDSITVANRDKPMTNLFEMGKMRIKLKPEAVLRGKIYIEEIRADSIQFGTPRTVSGALPGKPPKVKKEKVKSDAPPLVDLQNFDAKGLLEREFDKLRTPKLYDEAIQFYNGSKEKWQNNVDLAKARTEELKASAQPILSLNASSFKVDASNKESIAKTVSDINKIINDINAMVNNVQTTANDAANMVRDIENDINTAKKLEQNARTAITDDINHLKSYIDLSSGTALAALEPSIKEILSDTAEEYVDYGLRALEIFQKIQAEQAAMPKTEKPKKEPKVVFKGRDVVFPTRAYPAFYLGILASDFTIQPWNWAFDLRDVSTDPDLTNRPVSLKLGMTEQSGNQRKIAFDGSGDFRTKATDRFTTKLTGNGFPINFAGNAALSKAGINGFNSGAAFSVNFSGRTDGGISGGGDIQLSNAKLLNPAGTIAEALDEAIREAQSIDLGIQYTHWVNAKDEFKISTNIADLLAAALKRIVNAYMKKAMDEIERLLRARIEQYIDGRFLAKEDLDALFKLARGDKAALDTLKNSLNNKKAELEKQAKGFADQAAQQLKAEASKQGQQAVDDLKKGQTPTLQAPSTPGLPGGGLKMPGR